MIKRSDDYHGSIRIRCDEILKYSQSDISKENCCKIDSQRTALIYNIVVNF